MNSINNHINLIKGTCKHALSISVVAMGCFLLTCDKTKLDIKPNKSLVVPTTVQDFQAILDNTIFNGAVPNLGEIASDDYYLLPNVWSGLSVVQKNAYVWAVDVFGGANDSNWFQMFRNVFHANVVLDGLVNNNSGTDDDFNNLKGDALFRRAYAYWHLAQVFCKPYNDGTASADLGLPLRLKSDVLESVNRSTLQQTYDQIIADLLEAEKLMTIPISPYRIRPSKSAVQALLSRVYLSMSDYENALQYANNAILTYNELMDYNDLDSTSSTPVPSYNNEVLFHSNMVSSTILFNQSNRPVDTLLYRSYSENDLRKVIFFTTINGLPCYKGSYNQSATGFFGGIATDEVYLNLSECLARNGQVNDSMNALNHLLVTRWKTGTFTPYVANTADEALEIILTERRKELIHRGLRWMDLRRLNLKGADITLTRVLGNETYTIPPNSPRYVYPIPQGELNINPMPQNVRD